MAPSAPDLNIEPSKTTVDVRVIDTTVWISNLPIQTFIEQQVKGFDKLDAPSFSFLVEHPSGRKLLFDLGVRKDWHNMSPYWHKLFEAAAAKIDIKHGVREILEEHGVPGSSIEAVVWSHWHMDHVGDPSTFDPHTTLIVGPGFKEAMLPGYPANPDAPILESDYEGRELREIKFDQGKKIGRFNAFDYFGDGSFYLLDTPGHAIGHLCALARVTTGADDGSSSFIFMAGDAAHHGGEFRPSKWLPLPESISPHPLLDHHHHSSSSSSSSPGGAATPCPGEIFEKLLRDGDRTKPFFTIPKGTGTNNLDPEETERTIEKLQEADAHDKVFVVTAHDKDLLSIIDFFPKYASDFASKDWVQRGRWAFLKDLKGAVE
ncbi:hypothetical protein M406DRAFT_295293 [Cryphonectria parasitica EP155]|uniref:Metallo-beta-lactamase domain-containing protein n=1 Tax=Cryphonectria parasitica (strain ATCC 38755 / EP155) TaxID=660469 RepID=A0A9P4XVE1_CRYP1|nr:uncharacterized protein M406DRAFT_295293 [Cryphonectria parasitica EP155]KAF3761618.1 hypothetical protein M406DRAFT_295293 [Cryphonectria parasitica EP155]